MPNTTTIQDCQSETFGIWNGIICRWYLFHRFRLTLSSRYSWRTLNNIKTLLLQRWHFGSRFMHYEILFEIVVSIIHNWRNKPTDPSWNDNIHFWKTNERIKREHIWGILYDGVTNIVKMEIREKIRTTFGPFNNLCSTECAVLCH